VQEQNMNRALRAWGAKPPDWIKALAAACDRATQGAVARELEMSPAVVNQVLGRSYNGRMDRVEGKVRGKYMQATVDCPVLGVISTHDCLGHQERGRSFHATNPLRVALYRACKTCPNREKECSKSSPSTSA
jgi:hypothetical protein